MCNNVDMHGQQHDDPDLFPKRPTKKNQQRCTKLDNRRTVRRKRCQRRGPVVVALCITNEEFGEPGYASKGWRRGPFVREPKIPPRPKLGDTATFWRVIPRVSATTSASFLFLFLILI